MPWADDNPYYLLITGEEEGVQIDLGETGWATRYAGWMRVRSMWILMRKMPDEPVLIVDVYEGDQPYYVAHHVGLTGSAGGREIVAYGIGKKAADGTMTRLWVMPDGLVCGGDDVDTLGVRMIRLLGPLLTDDA